MTVQIDAPDLRRLEADISRAVLAAPGKVRAATEVSARHVKDSARGAISGLRHAPQYPDSITYDMAWALDGVQADIGPDKDRAQGALGNLLEFGSVHNAPLAHLGPALDRVAPDFERGIAIAVGDLP